MENLRRTTTQVLWWLGSAILILSFYSEAAGQQSSPFAVPAKNDVTFIVNSGPGLDTGCTFRSGGPLFFSIPVDRHLGNVTRLIQSGAIKPTATLRMPAFDVDFNGSAPPERDRVTFNGHVVPTEFLTGDDGVWKLNAFEIPIEWVNFPGDPVTSPSMNQIQIEIDTLSAPSERWCTAIDWASLSIEVARPHLLVHGILSNGATWIGPWTNGLEARGIPFDTIDLGALDSITANAGKISAKVVQLQQRWGVNKVNIVAHSKGGLDSRHFAEYNDAVARLTQIGTPNAGSPLADYIQVGLIGALPLGSLITMELALPAGYQLTTPYMGLYNTFHGPNLNTLYLSLAGEYSGAPLFSVDNLLGSIIPGPDDTIVPVSSVFALPYAAHIPFPTSGTNGQAKHTEQTKSPGIFSQLVGFTSAPLEALKISPTKSITQFALVENFNPSPISTPATPDDAISSPVRNLHFNADSWFSTGVDTRAKQTLRHDKHENSMQIVKFNPPMPTVTNSLARKSGHPSVRRVQNQGITSSPVNTAAVPGSASQGRTNSHTIPIDNRGSGAFTLFYGSGNLDMVLISPSGLRVDPVLAAVDPSIGFDQNESIEGFKSEVYRFNVLEIGLWTVLVNGALVPDPPGTEGYLVGAWLDESTISMNTLPDRPVYSVGDAITIRATLTDGTSRISDADVSADVRLPDNTTGSVSLRDDGVLPDETRGDGVYAGTFDRTNQSGLYHFAVKAERALFPPFSRHKYLLLPVSASTSSFTGTSSDRGIDSNGNSLFDVLGIDVEVNITREATYLLRGALRTSTGIEIGAVTSRVPLMPGTQNVRLNFDGKTIFQVGVDGPYSLHLIKLAEETASGDVLPVDEGQDVYRTAAYSFRAFERSAIFLTGTGSDVGIDTNSNGLFDSLRVSLDVEMRVPGNYQWTARLVDNQGKEIDFASNSGFLSAGSGLLVLSFNGNDVGKNGIDGPYRVTDLLVFGSGQSQVVFEAHRTASYRARDFEGFQGVEGDLDGDGDVDRIDLNILLAARNTLATGPNDPRDLDKDGKITALDGRKLVLLCTRPNCATE